MNLQLNASGKRGLLILLGLIVLLIVWKKFHPLYPETDPEISAIAETVPADTMRDRPPVRIDLNHADAAQLETLPRIGKVLSERIVKYRNRIGGFRDVPQLKDVYGVTPETYEAVHELLYVTPRKDSRTAASVQGESSVASAPDEARQASATPMPDTASVKPRYNTERGHIKRVNLNRADSLDLLDVPGIGPSTAGRIIRYRNSLGFFHSAEQVKEVWGLRPENIERMMPWLEVSGDLSGLPHVRINVADEKELYRHPYLRGKEARILAAYRQAHGPFRSAEDLLKVREFPAEKLELIRPYLDFSVQ